MSVFEGSRLTVHDLWIQHSFFRVSLMVDTVNGSCRGLIVDFHVTDCRTSWPSSASSRRLSKIEGNLCNMCGRNRKNILGLNGLIHEAVSARLFGDGPKAVLQYLTVWNDYFFCFASKPVTLTIEKVRRGVSEEGIREALTSQCKMYHIQEPAVCDGVIALYVPEIVHIANRTTLSPTEICSFALTKECGSEFDDNHDWSVPVPGGKPPAVQVEPSADGPRLKVLHISDTHLDPYYAPGSLASCALHLCCRLTSAPAETGRKQRMAGPWGDYGNCDTPETLLRSGLAHASKEHPDIDYILWTGDILPHDIWNQTREESLGVIRKTMNLFKEYFPRTPIFPAIGNHEAVPVNSFSPSDVDERFSMGWLYNEFAQQWPQLSPSITGNMSELIRKGAFYSVLAKPNLRIISVNTNFCNDKNWWLLLNNEDPEKELVWLINELKSAEEKGEKVHIIGHIPPGSIECRAAWSRNFDLIVNRFESTIKALFYGHTHNDEFELFFDRTNPSSLRPVAIAYLAPSVTPYGGGNPAYRIYSIDGEHPDTTWTVIDHDTWWMDLQAANQGYSPIWRRLYNARRAYNLQSLSPASWASLVRTMAMDDKVFDAYYRFYQRDSPRREKCDTPCRRRMLCDLLSGRSRDTSTCQVIWRVFDSTHPSSSWWTLLFGTYVVNG